MLLQIQIYFCRGIAFANRFIGETHKPSDKGSGTRAVPLNYQSMAAKKKSSRTTGGLNSCAHFLLLAQISFKKKVERARHCASGHIASILSDYTRLLEIVTDSFITFSVFDSFSCFARQTFECKSRSQTRSDVRATRTAKCILISN